MNHLTSEVLIRNNFHEILERIELSAASSGRQGEQVRLVVVTKGHPLAVIQAAIQAGARLLGENFVDEAVEKIQTLPGSPDVEWHMIGHVQSRKARLVSEYFHWLHSLDSFRLAGRLDRFAGEAARRLPALLECNVSGEESKFGFPAYDEKRWDQLLPDLEGILALPNLQVRGLMAMAPYSPNPEAARPHFRRLRRLLEFLSGRFPSADWSELSMGMSGDFEVAVQEGATLVRIGTAILGPRPGYSL